MAYMGIEQLKEFCNATTMLWVILVLASFLIAGTFISLSFEDWKANPVITTIDSTFFPVEEIPFPAIAVCSENENINDAERWGMVMAILDSLDFSCYEDEVNMEEYVCSPGQIRLRKDLAPLLKVAIKKMFRNAVTKYTTMPAYEDSYTTMMEMYDLDQVNFLCNITSLFISLNNHSHMEIVDKIIDIFGPLPGATNCRPFLQKPMQDFFKDMFKET